MEFVQAARNSQDFVDLPVLRVLWVPAYLERGKPVEICAKNFAAAEY